MAGNGSSGEMGRVIVVQGGQWGSEAKGVATAAIATHYTHPGAVAVVRTGAINAGHTVWHEGREFKMQQLPVGWVNPKAQLVLGPGAMIHLPTLKRELEEVEQVMPGVRGRLAVDLRAGLHNEEHMRRAMDADRHHLIGATGKGCSEALVARVMGRGRGYHRMQEWLDGWGKGNWPAWLDGITFRDDTDRMLTRRVVDGGLVVLEATQGHLLDLLTGPYPYTTHKPTSPAQWLAETGLSPALPVDVVLVVRTYPIRVAGNSGPMPGETSWPELARTINTKLRDRGLPPRVNPDSIEAFEDSVRAVARSNRFMLPPKSDGLDQHRWNDYQRTVYRNALSDMHAEAIKQLPDDVVTDLRRLFEFTTVTKKLRRVAELDLDLLNRVVEETQPASIFLTFTNYVHPELWDAECGTTDGGKRCMLSGRLAPQTVREVERVTGRRVGWFNTGPLQSHVHTCW